MCSSDLLLVMLITELFNSAIEALTDRVSLENHVLAKRAKDMGSAAVLLSGRRTLALQCASRVLRDAVPPVPSSSVALRAVAAHRQFGV